MQWQGKFLKIPDGTLYVGAEVTERMDHLGMMTRGLCKSMLSIVKRLSRGKLHYGFGDKQDVELPHIVCPVS